MKKFIAFGDSFINMFSPFLSFKTHIFKINKYKGATMKGIINKNENYDDILAKLNKYDYDYAFFGFGQVDFFFYYYFKKYVKNENNVLEKMYDNAEEYVLNISELPNVKQKIIFGILPSHIKNEIYKDFLVGYGIVSKELIDSIPIDDMDYYERNKRIIHYNNLLAKHCKKYNIIFCNVYDYLMINNKVVDIVLLKHNERNIHINYEILLLVYLKKCLKFLLQYYDINEIYNIMEYNYNKYMEPKKLGLSFNFDRINILKFIDTL